MTTNTDRAAQVIDDWLQENKVITHDTGNPRHIAQALADADCLRPDGMEVEWAVSVGWSTLDGTPIEQHTGWGGSEEEALQDARKQKGYYIADSREEGFISSRRQVTKWEPARKVEHDEEQA